MRMTVERGETPGRQGSSKEDVPCCYRHGSGSRSWDMGREGAINQSVTLRGCTSGLAIVMNSRRPSKIATH